MNYAAPPVALFNIDRDIPHTSTPPRHEKAPRDGGALHQPCCSVGLHFSGCRCSATSRRHLCRRGDLRYDFEAMMTRHSPTECAERFSAPLSAFRGLRLSLACRCGHTASLSIDAAAQGFGAETPIREVLRRARCGACGRREVDPAACRVYYAIPAEAHGVFE